MNHNHTKKTKTKQRLVKVIGTFLLFVIFFAPLFSYAQVTKNPDVPKIISRDSWGADESQMDWEIEYARAEKFVIHHTASSKLTPDSDGSGEYKSMVNSIYNYHNNGKTWYDDDGEYIGYGDIGYNYLIDPNGNIYEGRSGGNGAVGGHVKGYNSGSIGIAVLGTYGGTVKGEYISNTITPQIKNSLEKLIGWLAANNGVDINKTSDFKGKNIEGVVGHRDLNPTTCPGDNLYGQLENIRSNASLYTGQYSDYAYQIGGDKAVYILEEGYKKKFDSADNLPATYSGRIVKPISKDELDLFKYKEVITYPDGSLLQEFDNPMVYYIESSKKRAMKMSGTEFVKMGFDTKDIIKVFPSDLKLYDDGKEIKYGPDNKLVSDSLGNVYLIESGKKRKFTSPQLFEHLKYKWKNISKNSEIEFYLGGLDMVYPNGTLVSAPNNGTMYLIENYQRREIGSDTLLKTLGYKKSSVLSITQDEIDHFPAGRKMAYPDNTLIKAENYPAVYKIVNGERKEFTSAALFEGSGYSWKNVLTIKQEEIKDYPITGKVLYPDGFLIKSADDAAIYVVESGKKRIITSSTMFDKLGFKWSKVISVTPYEIQYYQNGKAMAYPEGALIKKKESPAIYKIENGKAKEFTSLSLFKATKSKWSDIIEISDEEFSAYPYGGNLSYPNGTLLKQSGDTKVYVIKNEKAEWIKTAEEFKTNKYKWSDIIEITQEEMRLYVAPEPEEQAPATENKTNIPESSETNNGNNPDIRIALYSSEGDDIKITANGNYAINYYDQNGKIYKTENKSSGEQTVVQYFSSSSYIKFVPSSKNVIVQVLSYSDPSWNKKIDDNEFRGNIEIKYSATSNKLWVINELPLEDYINGIAEALNESPEEYLKAFSTIARTYAMYYIKKGGKHAGEPFHLKNSRNGNGNDQVYKGYNFEIRASKIVAGSKSTAGYIINYDGNPIVAAYSSDSGGVTKNACDVLSKNYCTEEYAYLRGGIKDPSNTEHNQSKVSASHGTGMSAAGAYQMAVNGSLWKDIIEYYYPGVEIEKYY